MIPELSRDNPRLLELTEAYNKLNLFEHSLWKTWVNNIDIQNFRGEVGYLAQMWNMTEQRYQNTFDYLDAQPLMRWLGEDNSFGCVTFERNNTVFSRDLIDSICEMRFMIDALDIQQGSQFRLLDIGAGYGRYIHRCATMFPYAWFYGIDAIPLSTFVSEIYLKDLSRRGKALSGASVVALSELDTIASVRFDIATNMQSFSEMPLSAVNFWLDLCSDLNIKYFMLEPHAGDLIHPHYVTNEPDGTHKDYYHLFEAHGYKLKVQRPKFPREIAPTLIYSTDLLLFERG